MKEQVCLKTNDVSRLYVRFFDVRPDAVFGAIPVAKQFLDWKWSFSNVDSLRPLRETIDVIPTIYIENKVLKTGRRTFIDSLADNIVFLTMKYYKSKIGRQPAELKEIHIDCDWTVSTKDYYFHLLSAIRTLSGKPISCTLRLYPYKYPEKMGVPPVDRVSLMCYNLLSPLTEHERNSILDIHELKSYLDKRDSYPLQLDIALPLFSWIHIYQYGKLVAMEPVSETIKSKLKPAAGLWYKVDSNFVQGHLYLRKGDMVKMELINFQQLKDAIEVVKDRVSLNDNARIVLFHLDESNLDKYSYEEIHSIFTSFIH